ncbi:hypothetical protein [Burkholderia cepacia]|uniref:hypothetical protein n=1 Tax=Burkholderia cepacia TaxID=292 RepID=UPI000A72793E|nr:hypothetical protein [Burkholderia cepacia]
MNPKSYSPNDDPFIFVSAVLHAICRVLSDDQRLKIANELRDQAARVNDDAQNVAQQRFALEVASLAALAEEGFDAAYNTLSAGYRVEGMGKCDR